MSYLQAVDPPHVKVPKLLAYPERCVIFFVQILGNYWRLSSLIWHVIRAVYKLRTFCVVSVS
jgi:hypothetical protein